MQMSNPTILPEDTKTLFQKAQRFHLFPSHSLDRQHQHQVRHTQETTAPHEEGGACGSANRIPLYTAPATFDDPFAVFSWTKHGHSDHKVATHHLGDSFNCLPMFTFILRSQSERANHLQTNHTCRLGGDSDNPAAGILDYSKRV